MRTAFVLLCTLASTLVHADTLQCGDSKPQHSGLFSEDEWKAILDGKTHGDPVLEEVAALEATNGAAPVRATATSKQLSWAQARKMVLAGVVNDIHQSHNLRVELVTRSGSIYVTREPKIDAVFEIAHVVDPCHVFIRMITE
jgi:hypothetical protein